MCESRGLQEFCWQNRRRYWCRNQKKKKFTKGNHKAANADENIFSFTSIWIHYCFLEETIPFSTKVDITDVVAFERSGG